MPTDPPTVGAPAPPSGTTAPASQRRRRLWVVSAVLLLAGMLLVVGGAAYAAPQPLLPEATAALVSTDAVTVADEGAWLAFTPAATSGSGATGFIFYPGAKVPAAAYAPAAQAIAGAGYPTYIAEMPLNLAVLGGDAAADIQAAHPEVTDWVIGGHSLGGVMAAGYAGDHPDSIDGLALWASYPADDISAADLVVTSVYGTLDTGAERMTSPETKAKLPESTDYVPIKGGNHEQMGWYTGQPNDPPATISRVEQQALVVATTLEVLAAASR